MNGNRPTLSVCMIVKNEEALLASCLESIKSVADELIVVDTGSTDRTMEIARSFGARVFEHPWQKDFSLHRNQSISYATCDWILQIDADETLEKGGEAAIRQAIGSASPDTLAFGVLIRDFRQNGEARMVFNFPRLYRNHPGIKYRGIVHNDLEIPGRSEISDVIINHFGYDLDRRQMLRKFKRTVSLLRKLHREDPTDPRAVFYLTNSYSQHHRHKKTIEYARKTIELLRERKRAHVSYLSVYFALITSLAGLDRLDEAVEACEEALKIEPDYPDAYYMLSRLYYMQGKLEAAVEMGERHIRMCAEFAENPSRVGGHTLYTLQRYDRLKYWVAAAMVSTGRVEDGKKMFREAVRFPYEEHLLALESVHNVLAAGQIEAGKLFCRLVYQRNIDAEPFLLLMAGELATDDYLGWLGDLVRDNPPPALSQPAESRLARVIALLDPAHPPPNELELTALEWLVRGNGQASTTPQAAPMADSQVGFIFEIARILRDETFGEELPELNQVKNSAEIPRELVLMRLLLGMFHAMRSGEPEALLVSVDGVAATSGVQPPEVLDDVQQIMVYLVEVANRCDASLMPDAGSLALLVARQFFHNDVPLQVLTYKRTIDRAERNGGYDPLVRLAIRHVFRIDHKWKQATTNAEQVPSARGDEVYA